MRLVVLDTNVIVSAGIAPGGAPALIVSEWVLRGRVQVVVSPWVLAEYREVVSRAKFRKFGFPPLWLDFVVDQSLQIPDAKPWPCAMPEPKDAPFLALAHAACAALVTGNLRHFPEQERRGVKVIAPGEYLEILQLAAETD